MSTCTHSSVALYLLKYYANSDLHHICNMNFCLSQKTVLWLQLAASKTEFGPKGTFLKAINVSTWSSKKSLALIHNPIISYYDTVVFLCFKIWRNNSKVNIFKGYTGFLSSPCKFFSLSVLFFSHTFRTMSVLFSQVTLPGVMRGVAWLDLWLRTAMARGNNLGLNEDTQRDRFTISVIAC